MTHLLLTSIGLTNPQAYMFTKSLVDASQLSRCAIILNASSDGSQSHYIQVARQQLLSLGVHPSLVDVRSLNSWHKLTNADVIYIAGGNTFKLMNDINNGLGTALLIRAIKKTVLTIGVSAGSIICAPTIRIAGEIEPDANEVGIKQFKALGLIRQEYLPHYNDSLEVEVGRYENKYDATVIRSKDYEKKIHLFKIS